MRKTTKGALALGTGVALLLGGAGTFALWNDDADLGSGATITSGDLSITPAGAAAWAWTTGGPIADINAVRLVPGDSVTFTRAFDVAATGDHLAADITISGGALDAGFLTVSRSVVAPAGVTGSGTAFTFAPSNSATPRTFHFDVTYTITYPSNATTGQNSSVSLTDTKVLVQQVQL